MDQVEFENYIRKMKSRKEEGDYKRAAKIADKIPWDEVNDINVLVFAASIYEEVEHYNDARAILEYAYEIAPVKDRLYFALSLINAKAKEIKEAVNYYIDFYNAFPDDNRKYLLKYYIMKAKGATYDQQKRILDEYVKEEKDEKMIFELALISDKLGQNDEVITYCDYIIKFFGVKKNGYGRKALLLKRKYKPLDFTEEKLLENTEVKDVDDTKESEYEYKEPPSIYNETKMDEDKINIPVEKVERVTNIEEERKIKEILTNKDDELDENSVQKKLYITYTPDEESYLDKEKNNMAFLGEKSEEDKEKLKQLIKKLKEEDNLMKSDFNKYRQKSFVSKERFKKMKLNETKLHMIIEAHSKEEGVEIAQKELNYIHNVLNEKVSVAKASAYNMNEKGLDYYLEKIKGRDFIIENAGKLKNEILDEIEEYIINKKGKTIFALVDIINNFDTLASERDSFISRFDIYSVLSDKPQETLDVTKDEQIRKQNERRQENMRHEDIREKTKDLGSMGKTVENKIMKETKGDMTIDRFVEECKYYAKSIDCNLSSEVIPTLYEKVEELKDENIPLTKENAIALIEEAADRAEKPKLFSKPKYDKEGCLILSEEHFKF